MPKTPINPDQLVFSFLRDDPTYQADLLRSQITRDVERNIRKKLTEHLTQVVISTCHNMIEETVERAVNRAVSPLQKDFQELIKYLEGRPTQDQADWWKEGNACDTDDELPF
jgi:dsDNA-specific endonuclease/ATPase MutS2